MSSTLPESQALRIDPRTTSRWLSTISVQERKWASRGPRSRPSTGIPFAHKVALQAIAPGEAILKYGVPIAFATASIKPGGWVREHNAQSYFAAKR